MALNTTRVDPGGLILVPAIYPDRANLVAYGVGASLTISKGQAMGVKTSDKRLYPLNVVATDGTQIFEAFSQYSWSSDASNLIYLQTSGTPTPTPYTGFASTIPFFISGIFNPNDLFTSSTGTAVAEVDTITPTNPTTGDIYSVTITSGPLVDSMAEFTVGATQTAAAVVTGLTNAWNADPELVAYATPSGSGTFILTAKTAGEPLNLSAKAVGTGTVALVITTAAVSAQQAEVDTFTLTTNPSTGDTFTTTISYVNGTTLAVVATVGATQTVAAACALIAAAWNANPAAAAYATAVAASTTVTFTAVVIANAMSLAMTTTSLTTTTAKVVTKPALGRNIADIIPGNPTAHILAGSGFWVID